MLKVPGDRTSLESGGTSGSEVGLAGRGSLGALVVLGGSSSLGAGEGDEGLVDRLMGEGEGDLAVPRSRVEGLQRRPSQELEAAEKFVNSSAFHLDMLARLKVMLAALLRVFAILVEVVLHGPSSLTSYRKQ